MDSGTQVKPSYRSFINGNECLGDAGALTQSLTENGYLFLKGFLDRQPIIQLRSDILDICRNAGWSSREGNPLDGIWSGCQPPDGENTIEYLNPYRLILKLPTFQSFPHHPRLIDVAERILGGKVFVHPRKIGRVVFPQYTKTTTPPHQDYFYIRGASATYSAWIPIGDCPVTLGGLAVLRGSHKQGFLPHVPMMGTGGHGIELPEDTVWDTTDYEMGDVLFFHSHTIHKAMPNLTENRLRISVDNRYQVEGDSIDPSSLKPHFNLSLD